MSKQSHDEHGDELEHEHGMHEYEHDEIDEEIDEYMMA